jgi:hypothetical protein
VDDSYEQRRLPFDAPPVERPDGEQWPDDPIVRTRDGRICRESQLTRAEVEAGGIEYEDQDQDETGYPF